MKLVALVLLSLAAPVAAQTDPTVLGKRIGSLEAQMRAVQRKVFPGGDPKFFEPEIAPEAAPAAVPVGTPSTSPITDLGVRVDALERQQRVLTGQVEEGQFKLRQLEEALAKFRGDAEFRLNAIEGRAGTPALQGAAQVQPDPAPAPAATGDTLAPPPPTPEAQWRAAYALYVAKDYAKAAAAMQDFLAANAKSPRASNAQYWLGRTYMAQTQHAQAAKAFLDGYQKYPKGERAPDSLLWLGNALTALKKPDQACRALNELQSVYGERLTPALKDAAAKSRTAAKCGA